jgi:hypothetical protein
MSFGLLVRNLDNTEQLSINGQWSRVLYARRFEPYDGFDLIVDLGVILGTDPDPSGAPTVTELGVAIMLDNPRLLLPYASVQGAAGTSLARVRVWRPFSDYPQLAPVNGSGGYLFVRADG